MNVLLNEHTELMLRIMAKKDKKDPEELLTKLIENNYYQRKKRNEPQHIQ